MNSVAQNKHVQLLLVRGRLLARTLDARRKHAGTASMIKCAGGEAQVLRHQHVGSSSRRFGLVVVPSERGAGIRAPDEPAAPRQRARCYCPQCNLSTGAPPALVAAASLQLRHLGTAASPRCPSTGAPHAGGVLEERHAWQSPAATTAPPAGTHGQGALLDIRGRGARAQQQGRRRAQLRAQCGPSTAG